MLKIDDKVRVINDNVPFAKKGDTGICVGLGGIDSEPYANVKLDSGETTGFVLEANFEKVNIELKLKPIKSTGLF